MYTVRRRSTSTSVLGLHQSHCISYTMREPHALHRVGVALLALVFRVIPDSNPVDQLATWARRLYRKGVRHPFPFQACRTLVSRACRAFVLWCQCLHKYCPHWCAHKTPDAEAESEGSSDSKDKDEKLSILQWAVAFDRYALACAVIPIDGANGPPVWAYTSAMAHRSVVFQARLCLARRNSHFTSSMWSGCCRRRERRASPQAMAGHDLRPPSP